MKDNKAWLSSETEEEGAGVVVVVVVVVTVLQETLRAKMPCITVGCFVHR